MGHEKIKLLYTDIGRGHPFYLDGIVEELNRNGGIDCVHSKSNVFEQSNGFSLKAWQLARALYILGGKDNAFSEIYKKVRRNNNYNKQSFSINLLGRDIKRKFQYDASPLVVAHPLLVAILKGRKKLYYQHGELIAPEEAVVCGADKIFVPIESTVKPFLSEYDKENIIITGLCIEPSIVRIAHDCYEARMKRYDSNTSLTGCFISSGAEPIAHVRIIINSLISHLNTNGKAILFVKKDGILEKSIDKIQHSLKVEILKIVSLESIPYELPPLTIVQFSNRRDENRFTSHFFHNFDFFVSPSHERSNWAVGLGIPMFITEPAIGPFSPMNRQFLLSQKVAVPINNPEESKLFAFKLKEMHISGRLKQLSQNGWDKFSIDGFKQIVSYLKNIS